MSLSSLIVIEIELLRRQKCLKLQWMNYNYNRIKMQCKCFKALCLWQTAGCAIFFLFVDVFVCWSPAVGLFARRFIVNSLTLNTPFSLGLLPIFIRRFFDNSEYVKKFSCWSLIIISAHTTHTLSHSWQSLKKSLITTSARDALSERERNEMETAMAKKALSIVVMICNLLVALFIDKHEKKTQMKWFKESFWCSQSRPQAKHIHPFPLRVVKLNRKKNRRIYRMQNMQLEIPDVQHLSRSSWRMWYECVEEERPAICWCVFFSLFIRKVLGIDLCRFFFGWIFFLIDWCFLHWAPSF